MEHDQFQLERYIQAQAAVIERVESELAAGHKTTHWMWFVFPQLKTLGRSETARYYGITSKHEALAFWRHPMLGPRLKHCTELVLGVTDRTAHQIFGSPDDLKFRSCMTLFEQVASDDPVFARALEHFYAGERDVLTLQALAT